MAGFQEVCGPALGRWTLTILSPQSYLLMVTVIFLPYISKATSWCKDRLVGR